MEQRGELPQRRKISTGTVGWLESDIKEWLESRPFANPKNNMEVGK
jgi:predicted DNA-binding transcriptional regulator AlpA